MSIQNLIIGNQLIKTEAQKRKILLGGYLILIYIGMGLFFFVVSLFNPSGDPTSIFIGFFFSIVCLLFLRTGYTNIALVIHFIRANGIAFYFALKDENVLMTGTYMLFLPASLGALAVFGYTERWKGIGFASVSLFLFLLALLRPEKFFPGNACRNSNRKSKLAISWEVCGSCCVYRPSRRPLANRSCHREKLERVI